jgi:2-polyprenyl-3-methyl-5-hydroxy-6-metoxy-1,4-benzoquinol methylase
VRIQTDNWDQHWRTYAESASLNPAQAYRRKLVFESLGLTTARRPVRVVELGSGCGELAADVLHARPDAEFVGLDLSPSGVELSQKRVPAARFFQQDFTQPLTLDDKYRGWATHAVCSEVLEHVDDVVAILRNVRTLFAPGCRFVVTVPSGPMSAFDKHIGHRRHFTPRSLADTLVSAGLEVEALHGAGFPFFNLYRLAVIARGKKLIADAALGDDAKLPLVARGAMGLFSTLFKLNLHKTELGWQLVAVAVEPR